MSEGIDLQSMSRINAGDAHFFDDSTTPSKVRSYLDANKESEKVKGMKWLLAMMSKGRDVSEFFPNVVKNVVAKSVEVKKLVYIYLVHYADFNDDCREIALLSINSFQKDMSGKYSSPRSRLPLSDDSPMVIDMTHDSMLTSLSFSSCSIDLYGCVCSTASPSFTTTMCINVL